MVVTRPRAWPRLRPRRCWRHRVGMSEAGAAHSTMAFDVSKAGRPENSETQISVMMAMSTPAIANFPTSSSIRMMAPKLRMMIEAAAFARPVRSTTVSGLRAQNLDRRAKLLD